MDLTAAGVRLSWFTQMAGLESFTVRYRAQATSSDVERIYSTFIDDFSLLTDDALVSLQQTRLVHDWTVHHTVVSGDSHVSQLEIAGDAFITNYVYEFQVLGRSGDVRIESNIVSQSVTDASFIVQNVTSQVTSRSISLSWSPPIADSGSAVLGYSVTIALRWTGANPSDPSQMIVKSVARISNKETTHIHCRAEDKWSAGACILPYSTYTVSIVAHRVNGLQGKDVTLTVETDIEAPASVPRVSLVGTSGYGADFILEPVLDINGLLNAIVIQASVSSADRRRAADEVTEFMVEPDSSYVASQPYQFSITGLNPATDYVFASKIVTAHGASNLSAPLPASTPEVVPVRMDPPVIIRASPSSPGPNRETSGLWVRWVEPDPLPGRKVEYELAYFSALSKPIHKGELTDVYFKDLSEPIVIRASTSVGVGPWSASALIPSVAAAESSNDSVITISATVAGVAVFVGVLIAVIVFYRRRTQSVLRMDAKVLEQFVAPEVREALNRLRHGDHAIPREINPARLLILSEVGSGKFGSVHKAILDERADNGVPAYPVAVKKLIQKNNSAANRIDFLLEAAIMAQFSHENIINLIGVASQRSEPMIIVQFCENGCLLDFLEARGDDLPLDVLAGMGEDVAAGMSYMAGLGFVHRDLAARNVLVDATYRCKVSDFGFARTTDDNEQYYLSKNGQVPVRWTAVEALQQRKYSSASDVWSFGVLLQEIFTLGAKPYGDWPNARVWMAVVDEGYRMPQALLCPDEVYALMLRMWDADHHARPTFPEIEQFLGDMSERLRDRRASVTFSVADRLQQLNAARVPDSDILDVSGDEAPSAHPRSVPQRSVADERDQLNPMYFSLTRSSVGAHSPAGMSDEECEAECVFDPPGTTVEPLSFPRHGSQPFSHDSSLNGFSRLTSSGTIRADSTDALRRAPVRMSSSNAVQLPLSSVSEFLTQVTGLSVEELAKSPQSPSLQRRRLSTQLQDPIFAGYAPPVPKRKFSIEESSELCDSVDTGVDRASPHRRSPSKSPSARRAHGPSKLNSKSRIGDAARDIVDLRDKTRKTGKRRSSLGVTQDDTTLAMARSMLAKKGSYTALLGDNNRLIGAHDEVAAPEEVFVSPTIKTGKRSRATGRVTIFETLRAFSAPADKRRSQSDTSKTAPEPPVAQDARGTRPSCPGLPDVLAMFLELTPCR